MHDVTEGGLLGALREVAQASGLGLSVEQQRIPVLPECRAVCQALDLDPLGLLGSGALLITLAASEVPLLLSALRAQSIPAYEIGRMLAQDEGLSLFGSLGPVPLPSFPRDEFARYLSKLDAAQGG